MTDIKQYLKETNTVLLTKESFEYLKERASALDKIRAEIEAIIGESNLDDYDFCSGLICARNILDKYKAESEDKE